jgi:hypothetical protein
MLTRSLIILICIGLLTGCSSFDENYELRDMSVASSDTDTEQVLADLNTAIAASDEVFELHVEQTDDDTASVTLSRNGVVVGEAVGEEDFGRRGGEFEVHMTPDDFDLAVVSVTAPNGVWIRGDATSDGLTADIFFRDPNRSILEKIVQAVVEEVLEAMVEALVESLGGNPQTIDLSNLDVVWKVQGTPTGE